MTSALCCEFIPDAEATTMTQEGNLGADGSATALQVVQIRRAGAYRCRFCLRLIKNPPDAGITPELCPALTLPPE